MPIKSTFDKLDIIFTCLHLGFTPFPHAKEKRHGRIVYLLRFPAFTLPVNELPPSRYRVDLMLH